MNKRHYEHTLPNIRGSLSNTYEENKYFKKSMFNIDFYIKGISFFVNTTWKTDGVPAVGDIVLVV